MLEFGFDPIDPVDAGPSEEKDERDRGVPPDVVVPGPCLKVEQ